VSVESSSAQSDADSGCRVAIAAFCWTFATWWPGGRWEDRKAKVPADGLPLEFTTREGKITETEYRMEQGRLLE
jgi:hypothetical protein